MSHLNAVKREHDKHAVTFLTKGMTQQLTLALGRECELIHGPEALAPCKLESTSPFGSKLNHRRPELGVFVSA